MGLEGEAYLAPNGVLVVALIWGVVTAGLLLFFPERLKVLGWSVLAFCAFVGAAYVVALIADLVSLDEWWPDPPPE